LVCFPHAGGSASYFFPLSAALSPDVQVLALQYPGRQDRQHERCLTGIDEFADEAYAALEPVMSRPLAFFGHSMGAVIAYEVAGRMSRRLGAAPTALFASSRRAPSTYRAEAVHRRDDAGLLAELRKLSGTGAGILDDEELVRMILPPLRGDYTAIETYRPRTGPRLDCPVVALIGDQDPVVDRDEARAWGEHTSRSFTLRVFPGGHFYLKEHQQAVVDLVSRQLLP
jgi:surfactin synthase thioesterase subunit